MITPILSRIRFFSFQSLHSPMTGGSKPTPAASPAKLQSSKQDILSKGPVQPKPAGSARALPTKPPLKENAAGLKTARASSTPRSPRTPHEKKAKVVDENNNKKVAMERNKEKFKEARAKARMGIKSPGESPPELPTKVEPVKEKSTKANPFKNADIDCADVVELEGGCDTSRIEGDLTSSDVISDSNEHSMDPRSPPERYFSPEREKNPVRRCFYFDKTGARNERVDIDDDIYDEVEFSSSQTVYPAKLERQRTHAKVIRSRADQWRRYGALLQIYSIGGHIQLHNRKSEGKKTAFIKAGTKPPTPPKEPPITTLEEFFARTIPKCSSSISKEPDDPFENTSPDALTDQDNKNGKKEKKDAKKEQKDAKPDKKDNPKVK
uniref:Muscle M-line assembly protein unc-89 n=1 Tax=Bursaphelenchus xylophilus TaxID=6326 RepID=A0A1I7SRD0_BURXY